MPNPPLSAFGNKGHLFCLLCFCKLDISTVYIDHSHSISRAIMEDQPRHSHRILRSSKLHCGSLLQGHCGVSDRSDTGGYLERGEHIGIPRMNDT